MQRTTLQTSWSIEFEKRKAGNLQYPLEKLGERCFCEAMCLISGVLSNVLLRDLALRKAASFPRWSEI
jgi:hypothetical protein